MVVYDVIDENIDVAYNTTTGRFKANVGGLYAFFATISTDNKSNIADEALCFIHNFHPADKTRQGSATFESGSFKTKTLRTMLKLKAGDEMWVMRLCTAVDKNVARSKKFYSTFSGSLIEKDN